MTTAAGHDTIIVEIAPFQVTHGVEDATVLERSARLQQEFLRHQRGFLRRELLKGDGGRWLDIVYWSDEDAAHAVMPAVAGSPACQAYFGIMVGADPNDPSGGVSHFRRLRSYE